MTSPSPKWQPTKVQALVLLGYAMNVVLTYLSNTGAYGCTNKQQSDKYYTLLTPPGWAFAIWGAIFIWEFIACAYQALPSQKENVFANDKYWLIGWGIVCVLQSAWSIIFCKSVETSAAILFGVWCGLVLMAIRAWRILNSEYDAYIINKQGSPKTILWNYLLMVAPFSLHAGWVTAATTLNIQIATIAKGATPETLLSLAVLCLTFVVMVAWTVGGYNADVIFGLGITWALFAVSHHEARAITTTEGPFFYSNLVETAVAGAASGATYLVATFVLLRAAATIKAVFKPSSPSTSFDEKVCEAECLLQDAV